MTPEAAKVEELIRETCAAFISHPNALQITCQESKNGDATWVMRSHPEDEPKIVGTNGCHIKALTFLVGMLGLIEGKDYEFEFVTERHNPTRKTKSA